PERLVGWKHDDGVVRRWAARRVLQRAADLLRAVGERDDDAADVFTRLHLEREVENVSSLQQRRSEPPRRSRRGSLIAAARNAAVQAVAAGYDTGDRELSVLIDLHTR